MSLIPVRQTKRNNLCIKKQLNSLKQQLQYQKISCQNENNRIKSKDQNVFSDDSIRRFSNDIKYADNLENVFDEFFNNEKNLPSAHNYVQNFQNSNEMNYNGAVDKDSISGLRKDIKKADDFEKANEKFPTVDNFVQILKIPAKITIMILKAKILI